MVRRQNKLLYLTMMPLTVWHVDAFAALSVAITEHFIPCKETTTIDEKPFYSNNNGDESGGMPTLPAPRREDKIARFKAKQQAKKEVERLKSLRERRGRIGISAEEVMDEFDEETLDRTVAMTNILLSKAEALEEWAQTIRELPMIDRMVQAQEQQSAMEKHLSAMS